MAVPLKSPSVVGTCPSHPNDWSLFFTQGSPLEQVFSFAFVSLVMCNLYILPNSLVPLITFHL